MLSLVVIGRDVSAYIDTCFESIARNRARDFEVIFVDDASRDDTLDIVARFEQRLPSLSIIRHSESLGLAAARNSGLDAAQGEYIAFLDGDDWLGVHAIGAMARTLEVTKADFLRVDHVRVVGKERQIFRAPEFRRDEILDPRATIGRMGQTTLIDYPYTWAGAFNRRLLSDGLLRQNPRLRTAEDRPWIWRLHLQSSSVVVTSLTQHFYRRGLPTSLSQTGDERQLDYLQAYAEVLEVVSEDRDAERLLPRAAAQFLAIALSHLNRQDRLSEGLRCRHRSRLREFLQRSQVLLIPEIQPYLREERFQPLLSIVHSLDEGTHGPDS